MSLKYFEDDCPGCRPVLLDFNTMKAMPEDSKEMQAVLAVWGKTTVEERQAFHRFTCQNSRTPGDIEVMKSLSDKISKTLKETG